MELLHKKLTGQIIECAMSVHTRLGPGLLEKAYEIAVCHELTKSGLAFRRQVPVPLYYEDVCLGTDLYLDVVVEDLIVLELKSVTRVLAVHELQLLTYLYCAGKPVGLLINFNVVHLRNGIKRRVNSRAERRKLAADAPFPAPGHF